MFITTTSNIKITGSGGNDIFQISSNIYKNHITINDFNKYNNYINLIDLTLFNNIYNFNDIKTNYDIINTAVILILPNGQQIILLNNQLSDIGGNDFLFSTQTTSTSTSSSSKTTTTMLINTIAGSIGGLIGYISVIFSIYKLCQSISQTYNHDSIVHLLQTNGEFKSNWWCHDSWYNYFAYYFCNTIGYCFSSFLNEYNLKLIARNIITCYDNHFHTTSDTAQTKDAIESLLKQAKVFGTTVSSSIIMTTLNTNKNHSNIPQTNEKFQFRNTNNNNNNNNNNNSNRKLKRYENVATI